MPYPESSNIAGGDTALATQYNNLRKDALYPILQSFTYGETIAVNDTLYQKASDGKVYKTDADFDDENIHNFIGFAKEAGVLNDVKNVQVAGKVGGLSGLTVGSRYYLSGTAGAISTTPGAYKKAVGIAVSATELLIEKYTELTNRNFPARVKNTVYQNGNKWRIVTIIATTEAQGAGGDSGSVIAYIENANPPTAQCGYCASSMTDSGGATGGNSSVMTLIIPPLWYYKVTCTATKASIGSWHEIDINW